MSPVLTRRNVLISLGAATAGVALPAVTALLPAVANGQSRAAGPLLPFDPVSLADYEQLARERLPHAAWETISSGCADDVTLRWNREAFEQIRLLPRLMIDVTNIDTRLTLLGHSLPHPILIAPSASHMLAHPDGEVATVRGAGAANAVMVASSASNRSIEEIVAAAAGPVWFQVYVQNDRGRTKALIERAEAAGARALCITVDQPVGYARDRVSHVSKSLPRHPIPNTSNLPPPSGPVSSAPGARRKFTWKDLEWAQTFARTPILLKGILHPDDADQAVRAGVAGIVVSNHGGRALDTVPATIEALPRVADRVAGRVPVLMDGGVRRGTDVMKALAFGAAAILIGRPPLYGLAVGGAQGVQHVVEILRTEFEAVMALTGRTSLAAIDRSVIWQR